MANHVSGYLSVRTISEEGQKVWDEYVVGTLEKYKGIGGRQYDVHLGFFAGAEEEQAYHGGGDG